MRPSRPSTSAGPRGAQGPRRARTGAADISPSGTTWRLAEAGIEPSTGSGGDPFDDAPAETAIGLLETEVIRRRGPWRGPGRSLEAVGLATLKWVHRFDTRRLLGPIGHVPPAQAEKRHHEQVENTAMAA